MTGCDTSGAGRDPEADGDPLDLLVTVEEEDLAADDMPGAEDAGRFEALRAEHAERRLGPLWSGAVPAPGPTTPPSCPGSTTPMDE